MFLWQRKARENMIHTVDTHTTACVAPGRVVVQVDTNSLNTLVVQVAPRTKTHQKHQETSEPRRASGQTSGGHRILFTSLFTYLFLCELSTAHVAAVEAARRNTRSPKET